VTINEIIELAKGYSTDKSNVFINGVLDAVVVELTTSERLKKIGRGLHE
jgi:N utilization substance protein B